ncbi:hypothetical protein [Litoribrevibacter albus]|uniref:Uncharacterized protein n=1 Tax=Litoribrevibacter albus TaxID=1473156 RepID=A0AA37S7D9_9GAMM|nr:hypothetical protein [Litoribrevibacter albus]GLQ29537.1 hypothetical protein GCM10007876_00150 [Litoribrevibacter albus]
MSWTTDLLANEQHQHTLIIDGAEFETVKSAIVQCADKAFSMFDETVLDTSMFCLFEWQADEGTLTVVVTDETKQSEGKHRVSVVLPELRGEQSEDFLEPDFLEDMQAFIRDYLTTCLPFLQFSLIAAFSLGNRQTVKML